MQTNSSKDTLSYWVAAYELDPIFVTSKSKRKSHSTYVGNIKKFYNFIGEKKLSLIGPDEINIKYKTYLEERGQKVATIIISLKSIRFLFEYINKKGGNTFSPTKIQDRRIALSNKGHYIQETLTDSDIELFKKVISENMDNNNPTDLRNKIVFLLLAETGMTVSELNRLKKSDINFQKSLITLHNPSAYKHRNRSFIVSNEIIDLASLIYKQRESLSQYNDFLVVGYRYINPNKIEFAPLTTRGVQRLIMKIRNDSGTKKKLTQSMLRATYIVNKLINQENIIEMRESLGYSLSNSHYLRYFPAAREKLGINSAYIEINSIHSKYKLSYQQLYELAINGSIRSIFFRRECWLNKKDLEKFSLKKT